MIGIAGAPFYLPATADPGALDRVRRRAERTWTVIIQSLHGIASILSGASARRTCKARSATRRSRRDGGAGPGLLHRAIGVISTAIGLFNLFPIPILDGGHFVAFLIEAVRGRPPSPAVMDVAMSIGLGLILLLMVFATYNDIMRMVS